MGKLFYYKKPLTAFLSLLLCALSIAQSSTLTGIVKSRSETLPSATVSIAGKSTFTDKDGKFSISIDPGKYVIIITHAGYNKIEQTIIVEAGRTNSIEFTMIANDQLEEVRIGSRSVVIRTSLNTAVPVDIFSSAKLIETGQVGLVQSLNHIAPSLTTGKQEFSESMTLRGLSPDHLLILVDEIRYHNSASLNNGSPKSTIGRGSLYNDLNSIPFPAVEKVEILRDGAAAQYGSDGVAGVMNIVLKRKTGKASFQLHNGQFYKGDGEKFSFGAYKGFTLHKKNGGHDKQGFMSIAGDIRFHNPTTRAGEYLGTVYHNIPFGTSYSDSIMIKALDDSIVKARGIDKKEFSKYNGINKVISSGFLMNGDYPVGKNSTLSWIAMINHKESQSPGTYRYARNPNQVNTLLFPNGFKPNYKATYQDLSLRAGFATETNNNWHLNFTTSFGSNSNENFVYNSNNASQQFTLGKNAPTEFHLGKINYKLFLNNFSFIKDFTVKNSKLKTCNLAIGAEWRLENYQQQVGNEASYKNYDIRKQGGSQPSVGSAGNHVNKNRTVSSVYVDLELEPNDRLLLDIASRYEYYSDFGGNIAGKLAARYKLSDKFFLRGAINNGFRAPSIQQRFFEGTQSYRGTALTSGIFSNNSPVTKAFNIPSLQAERSINISGGMVSKISGNISLTVDAYWIQIKHRVVLTGVFDKSNPDIVTILGNYPNIDVVQFYVNAINTKTKGIDAVLNGKWKINKTRLDLTLAASFNRNSIFGPIKTTVSVTDPARYTNTLFGVEERTTLENDQPRKKIILHAAINKGKFRFVFRNTLFGNTGLATIVNNPTDTLYESFSSKILTDLSFSYTPKSMFTITAGANNIFNVYPDRIKNYRLTSQGITIYSNGATPFGANGGYYYVNMSFNF